MSHGLPPLALWPLWKMGETSAVRRGRVVGLSVTSRPTNARATSAERKSVFNEFSSFNNLYYFNAFLNF
jgi:hypothetical protein